MRLINDRFDLDTRKKIKDIPDKILDVVDAEQSGTGELLDGKPGFINDYKPQRK